MFNDKAKENVTSIVNPEIAKVLGSAVVSHCSRTPVLVLDVPLLFGVSLPRERHQPPPALRE